MIQRFCKRWPRRNLTSCETMSGSVPSPANCTRSVLDRRRFLLVAAGCPLCLSGGPVQAAQPMTHIVLLGDSVFDNAAYVAGGTDVIRQLRYITPAGWQATLKARDGALIAEIDGQLDRLPMG